MNFSVDLKYEIMSSKSWPYLYDLLLSILFAVKEFLGTDYQENELPF